MSHTAMTWFDALVAGVCIYGLFALSMWELRRKLRRMK